VLALSVFFKWSEIWKNFWKKHEETLVKRQQHRYRESLESQREQDTPLLLDGSAVALRSLFYYNDLLKRRCPERREFYLKPLRHYRLTILNWSDERAAREARISLSQYKRIEGLKFKERPREETIAHICAAFGVDADQLGFDQFYPEDDLTRINLRARGLRLAWREGGTIKGDPLMRSIRVRKSAGNS
jgi:transcriptional regulator with XRE-family HTH domain